MSQWWRPNAATQRMRKDTMRRMKTKTAFHLITMYFSVKWAKSPILVSSGVFLKVTWIYRGECAFSVVLLGRGSLLGPRTPTPAPSSPIDTHQPLFASLELDLLVLVHIHFMPLCLAGVRCLMLPFPTNAVGAVLASLGFSYSSSPHPREPQNVIFKGAIPVPIPHFKMKGCGVQPLSLQLPSSLPGAFPIHTGPSWTIAQRVGPTWSSPWSPDTVWFLSAYTLDSINLLPQQWLQSPRPTVPGSPVPASVR